MTTASTDRREQKVTTWWRLTAMVIARMILGVAAGLAVWALILVPFGYKATVTASGSMQPRVGIGDVVVTHPIDAHTDLLGRVVTADNPAKPGTLLTHRIVFDNHDGTFKTKGDANADPDSTPMPRGNIKGRGFLLVPWIGLPAHWISAGEFAPLVATLAGMACLGVLARDPRDEEKDEATDGPRHSRLPARPRTAGVVALALVIVAGSAVCLSAGLGRSSAAYTKQKPNTGNTWLTEQCPGATTFPFSFESNMTCWQGANLVSGPTRDTSWIPKQGSYDLKGTINMPASGSNYPTIYRSWQQYDLDLSGKTTMSVTVGRDNGGVQGTPGLQAKLYIKYGSGYTWYDNGSLIVLPAGPASTTINLNLSAVPSAATNLKQIKEIGVQFIPATGSSGQCTVYADNFIVA